MQQIVSIFRHQCVFTLLGKLASFQLLNCKVSSTNIAFACFGLIEYDTDMLCLHALRCSNTLHCCWLEADRSAAEAVLLACLPQPAVMHSNQGTAVHCKQSNIVAHAKQGKGACRGDIPQATCSPACQMM